LAILLCEPGGRPMASSRSLVAASLEFAVPCAIASVRDVPGPVRKRLAAECSALLAAHGELAWLAVRAHEDGDGLTRLARGLAALACRPGGVSYLGMTWAAVPAWEEGQAAA